MRDQTQTTRLATAPSPFRHHDSDRRSDLPVATKLLISVRNAEEATLVRDAGVDWIDLKEPQSGALGRSSLNEARAVAERLGDHPQRSAALGELCDLDDQTAFEFAPLFPILKVGLSRQGSNGRPGSTWQTRFESLATQLKMLASELIPVAYADWSICEAPSPHEVLQVARQVGASFMLIDTFAKDGRCLLDWITLAELERTIGSAREFKCGIVLAGSLRTADAPTLLKLQPAALAVRGAVCRLDDSDRPDCRTPARTSPIDQSKVELWRSLV